MDYGGKIRGRHLCGIKGAKYFYLTKSMLFDNPDLLSNLSKVEKSVIVEFLNKYWDEIPAGRVKEGRMIYSLKIGRMISEDEQIHHIDEKKLNDSIDNLQLMSCGEHSSDNGNLYSLKTKNNLEISTGIIDYIEEIEQSQWTGKYVYNLEIEKHHRYFAGCVLVSNCHKIIDSKMFKQTISKCSNTIARHGFSGSPFSLTTDDLELESVTGPPLSRVKLSDLIEAGWISRPTVNMVKYNSDWFDGRISFIKIYKNKIVENSIRNSLISKIAYDEFSEGNLVLILVRIIEHGKIIKDLLVKMGIEEREIKYVHGSSPPYVRAKVKQQMKDKEVSLVIASQIWNEGIDIPSIDVLIKADGGGGGGGGGVEDFVSGIGVAKDETESKKDETESKKEGRKSKKEGRGIRSVIQQVGRVLRKPKDPAIGDVNTSVENVVRIYDFFDNIQKDLRNHSTNRFSTYKMEKAFIVRSCPYEAK